MSPPPTAKPATAHKTLSNAQRALVETKKLDAQKKKQTLEKRTQRNTIPPSSAKKAKTKATPKTALPEPFSLADSLTERPESPTNTPKTTTATVSSPNRPDMLDSDPDGTNSFATQESSEDEPLEEHDPFSDLSIVDFDKMFDSMLALRRKREKQASDPQTLAAKAAKEKEDGDKKPAAVETPPDAILPSEEIRDPVARLPEETPAAALAAAEVDSRTAAQRDGCRCSLGRRHLLHSTARRMLPTVAKAMCY